MVEPAQPAVASDIVANLASSGEPSAFYSLFGAQVIGAYAALISSGMDQQKAYSTILSFFKRTYRTFGSDKSADPLLWFDQQCRKHLKIPNLSLDTHDHSLSPAEEEQIRSHLQVVVQREYSRNRRNSRQLRVLRQSAAAVRRNPLLRTLMLVLLFATILYGVDSYLRMSDSVLTIAFDTRDFRSELSAPVSRQSLRITNKAFAVDSIPASSTQPSQAPTIADTADTVPKVTQKALPPKPVSKPKRVELPATVSPGPQDADLASDPPPRRTTTEVPENSEP